MEEITFLDVLTHYQLKLKEAADEVERIKNQIKQGESCLDAGWTGDAANACRIKLETIHTELAKALAELSEAQLKLSAIGELLADGATIPV